MTAQRFNILLVDDSPSDARLFEMALREVAPRVSLYWVATGEEALEALHRSERLRGILGVDIVILDLNLPPTNGLTVLQRIKEDEKLVAQPVVVMSSSSDPDEIRRSYQLGANAYHVKPMTLEGTQELLRCIARYWLDMARLPKMLA